MYIQVQDTFFYAGSSNPTYSLNVERYSEPSPEFSSLSSLSLDNLINSYGF